MHNRITKKVIKTLMKRTLEEVASSDLEKAAASLKLAASRIDKAGARRVLHPNTAARRKSRLAREYNAAVAKAQQSK
jgi:small subunit ribosomal protein S20